MSPLLLAVALTLSPHRPLVALGQPPVVRAQAEITMRAWCDAWQQPTIIVTNHTPSGIAVSWTLIALGTVESPTDGDMWSDVSLLEPWKSEAWISPVSSLRLVVSYLDKEARPSEESIDVSCP